MANKAKRNVFDEKVAEKSSKKIIMNVEKFKDELTYDLLDLEELRVKKRLEAEGIKVLIEQKRKGEDSFWTMFWGIIVIMLNVIVPHMITVIGEFSSFNVEQMKYYMSLSIVIISFIYIILFLVLRLVSAKKLKNNLQLSVEKYTQLKLEIEVIENAIYEMSGNLKKNTKIKRFNGNLVTIKND